MKRRQLAALVLPAFLAACRSDGGPAPRPLLRCDGTSGASASVASYAISSAPTLSLAQLQGTTLSGTDVESCISLAGSGARYLVVPQFATGGKPASHSFFVGAFGRPLQAAAAPSASVAAPAPADGGLQQALDRTLRGIEHAIPVDAVARPRTPATRLGMQPAAVIETERAFSVLGDLQATSWKSDTAVLKYTGNNILLYVSKRAPAGFTDDELTAFGTLFDGTLYPIDTTAFGRESDIDGNGRVIMLLSPYVNALSKSAECSTRGFVTGYFFGHDLTTQANSNRAEIFYGLVPDPNAVYSCAHSVAQVKSLIPQTFVHELQHMISYNQHVLVRRKGSEEVWLNEALSLMAEEFVARHYEALYPAPTGRLDPTAPFPDSAASFIVPNLRVAHRWLQASTSHSVTAFKDFGTVEERGAAWLFLQWLGAQKGNGIYRALVQSDLVGLVNVEARAGESFPALFGDFSVAVYTDSIPGVARTQVPSRYRFAADRNLRRLFTYYRGSFPIALATLSGAGTKSGMVQGTMDHFELQTDAGIGEYRMQLTDSTYRLLDPALRPQLSIFRLPNP